MRICVLGNFEPRLPQVPETSLGIRVKRETGDTLPTRLLVATLVWEPRAGGGGEGGDPPFSDDDPEQTRNETA